MRRKNLEKQIVNVTNKTMKKIIQFEEQELLELLNKMYLSQAVEDERELRHNQGNNSALDGLKFKLKLI